MVVLRNNVKRKSTRASATRDIPHLSIAPYKEGVAIVQKQMPFRAILRSWTLLPSHKLLTILRALQSGPRSVSAIRRLVASQRWSLRGFHCTHSREPGFRRTRFVNLRIAARGRKLTHCSYVRKFLANALCKPMLAEKGIPFSATGINLRIAARGRKLTHCSYYAVATSPSPWSFLSRSSLLASGRPVRRRLLRRMD